MPQDWENGNAARQYEADTSPNMFTPIDYAARLNSSGKRRRSSAGSTYQPGQTYGAPVPSAPPMASPAYEQPSYLQQQEWMPAQEYQPGQPVQSEPGAPYTASLFEHHQTAVMPSGLEDGFFQNRSGQELWQEDETPVQQQEQPVYYSQRDIPLRDPFTPAEPREEKPGKAASSHQEPPRRRHDPLEMALRIAAFALLAVNLVLAVPMIAEFVTNERESEVFREEYLKENGVDIYHGAIEVELPPVGETIRPSPTPTPTVFMPTPSPTPIIPIPGIMDTNRAGDEQPQPQETPTPPPRTRLLEYPKNPMRNVTESLREMTAENPDVIGRLVIQGVLDEMVMQRNNTYYLTHNAIGASSEAGAVFADESCALRIPPENLLLRGQSDAAGKTFAPLWQYVSGGRNFVASNMIAKLTTLYEEESYVLFAVIAASRDPSSAKYFNYASNPTFATDEAMLRYVENARAHSIYPFNVDVNASDRLLTLATLGSGENTLVLMYRMVRDTENMGQ